MNAGYPNAPRPWIAEFSQFVLYVKRRIIKRVVDVAASAAGLILLAPFLIVVALAI